MPRCYLRVPMAALARPYSQKAMIGLVTGALALALAQDETATYTLESAGVTFTYPASWEVESDENASDFRIPLESGGQALVRVYAVDFREPAEIWQQVQMDANTAMRRDVTRQWQERLLGVPLLLTRIAYTERNVDEIALVGLLYARTDAKMLFRVVSRPGQAQEAENAWRNVLLSLRTTTGELPQVEDPNRTEAVQPVAPEPPPREFETVRIGDGRPAEPTEPQPGRNTVPLTLGDRNYVLNLPDRWTAEVDADVIRLIRGDLKGEVILFVREPVDGQVARPTVPTRQLDEMTVVTLRENSPSRTSRAGALTAQIVRHGQDANGDVTRVAATFLLGDLLWEIDYRVGPRWDYDRDTRALEELFDRLLVRRAP